MKLKSRGWTAWTENTSIKKKKKMSAQHINIIRLWWWSLWSWLSFNRGYSRRLLLISSFIPRSHLERRKGVRCSYLQWVCKINRTQTYTRSHSWDVFSLNVYMYTVRPNGRTGFHGISSVQAWCIWGTYYNI